MLGLRKAGHNPECRAWRWLARTSGELLRLYQRIGQAKKNGAKEGTNVQAKQAQGLRGAVTKGLWQEKEVQEDVRQLGAVVANSLGRQQFGSQQAAGAHVCRESERATGEQQARSTQADGAQLADGRRAARRQSVRCTSPHFAPPLVLKCLSWPGGRRLLFVGGSS